MLRASVSIANVVFFWVGEEKPRVADSVPTFHVTGNPMTTFDLKPPVGKSTVVVGDTRSLQIEYYGKMSMVAHSIGEA